MGEKLKYWRHELKLPLKIRADDTLDTVKARAGAILQKYDPTNVNILLKKWCGKKNQIGHNFTCSYAV
jgi:uncharacterized protein YmfQ (DUF2313 family)